MSTYSVVSFSATVEILNRYIGEAGGSADQKKTQTIGPNCSMTHSPGKIEYNCRYFIMTFRKQIGEYKFGKNCFHTLQSTMSHRPLTNTSSLKIAAAYYPPSIDEERQLRRWLASVRVALCYLPSLH